MPYQQPNDMATFKTNQMTITPFLTFVGDQCGKAEEAINFYISIFPNSNIKSITKYSAGEPGGTPELIKYGIFSINSTEYRVSESNYNHAWSFTPGVSLFVECTTDKEIETLFDALSSNGGQVMIPLDSYDSGNYGFGKKFGWCEDRYGISWQLNLS